MAMNYNDIQKDFPGLSSSGYEITSPYDRKYNCIAWATGDQKRWWEPDPMGQYYWPVSAPRKYTIEAYMLAFQSVGYLKCDTDSYEIGHTKVAIFSKENRPTHASRQLSFSLWTSKLGRDVDICHQLHALCGELYGDIAFCMRRVE